MLSIRQSHRKNWQCLFWYNTQICCKNISNFVSRYIIFRLKIYFRKYRIPIYWCFCCFLTFMKVSNGCNVEIVLHLIGGCISPSQHYFIRNFFVNARYSAPCIFKSLDSSRGGDQTFKNILFASLGIGCIVKLELLIVWH